MADLFPRPVVAAQPEVNKPAHNEGQSLVVMIRKPGKETEPVRYLSKTFSQQNSPENDKKPKSQNNIKDEKLLYGQAKKSLQTKEEQRFKLVKTISRLS
jgi:hypothetical protein